MEELAPTHGESGMVGEISWREGELWISLDHCDTLDDDTSAPTFLTWPNEVGLDILTLSKLDGLWSRRTMISSDTGKASKRLFIDPQSRWTRDPLTTLIAQYRVPLSQSQVLRMKT